MNSADFTYLNTKLVPQRTRSRLIVRPRLLESIAGQAFPPKLIAVYAPAGYGKSTLVSQYLEAQQEGASAWYSLDDGDNNLDVFTQYFILAYRASVSDTSEHRETKSPDFDGSFLDGEVSGRGAQDSQAQDRQAANHQKIETYNGLQGAGANAKTRLTQLFNEVASAARSVRVVLDDFHLITNPRVLETIEWILRSMPEQMTLIITSRERPSLSCMTELAVQGCLMEITAKQLRLSMEETDRFLFASKGERLDQRALAKLYERTEGWVAATQLASHAMRDYEDPQEFVTQFSGTDKDIVHYLGAMVLNQQAEELQNFFLYTSILKRLNAELCAVITGNQNSSALLNQISSEGLFLFELDREGEWYRYHHLFGEYLLSRFKTLHPEQFRESALKAAQWCLQQNDIHEAIDYYLLAEHFDSAVALMVDHVSQLVQYRGHHEVLLRWVEKLPPRYLETEPRLAICYAWSLIFTRNLDQVDSVLSELQSANLKPPQSKELLPGQDEILWNVGMLSAMHDAMAGRASAARAKTSQWLVDWPNAPAFERGTVLGVHGASCIQYLDFKVARKVLRDAIKAFSSCEAEYGLSWMSFMYALVLVKQGQLHEARHMLENSLKSANANMGELSLASALLHLGLGYACYVMNDLSKARAHIEKGFLSIEEHGHVETVHLAFLTKSNLLLRAGAGAESMTLLYEAEDFGRRLNLLHYETAIVSERIRRLLDEGRVEEARGLAVEHGYLAQANSNFIAQSGSSSEPLTVYEAALIQSIEVRMLIEEGAYEEVIGKCAVLLEQCQRSGLVLDALGLAILQARAYFESGHTNKSFRLLNKLVESAAAEKVFSPFIEEKRYLEPLWGGFYQRYENDLKNHPDKPLTVFLRSLNSEFGGRDVDVAEGLQDNDTAAMPQEALSKKEREILKYLDQGLTNKELASTLFVSVSTIKWHLTHIYSKLGVKNRVEAIKSFQTRS